MYGGRGNLRPEEDAWLGPSEIWVVARSDTDDETDHAEDGCAVFSCQSSAMLMVSSENMVLTLEVWLRTLSLS